jgi:hypothetical protein
MATAGRVIFIKVGALANAILTVSWRRNEGFIWWAIVAVGGIAGYAIGAYQGRRD